MAWRPKPDRVAMEIAFADVLYHRYEILRAMQEAVKATARALDMINEVSIEAALFAKDDPFCEDGSPSPAAMADFAACDAALERLSDIATLRSRHGGRT
jgi:hypothetical protein